MNPFHHGSNDLKFNVQKKKIPSKRFCFIQAKLILRAITISTFPIKFLFLNYFQPKFIGAETLRKIGPIMIKIIRAREDGVKRFKLELERSVGRQAVVSTRKQTM